MTAINIGELLEAAERNLLEAGGVYNWRWYDEALEDYNETGDPAVDNSAWLSCLDGGGVDNWEWYYDSLEPLEGYREYLENIKEGEPVLDVFNFRNQS